MRALEQEAIASGRVTGLELMERAGNGVVEAIFEEWPELSQKPPKVLVFCGPGNNGGDGFVVARLLTTEGWEVEVFLYGKADRLPPDAKTNYYRWSEMGPVHPWDDHGIRLLVEGDEKTQFLFIDALFGLGLDRKMPEDTYEWWRGLMPAAMPHYSNEPHSDRYVAIDIPSGISSDTGYDLGALPTHLTVTFHKPKIGHFATGEGCKNYGGAYGCGKVVVKDIGL